jgi:hypothetical protein
VVVRDNGDCGGSVRSVRDEGGIPVNLWQFTIVSVLITSEPSSSAWLAMHWTLILPNKNLGMLFNIIYSKFYFY